MTAALSLGLVSELQVVVPEIDPLVLESIFPKPGRNDPCWCGSGQKYKRCCLSADEEVWRGVQKFVKEADAMSERICAMPSSKWPGYDP